MKKKTVTETQIGNTLFIVTSECSTSATETIEKKLERLICRRFHSSKSYPQVRDIQLDESSNQSEHGTSTI